MSKAKQTRTLDPVLELGELNPFLDANLLEEPEPVDGLNYEGDYFESKDCSCQLCKIYRPQFSASENIFYEDDSFYIAEAKGKKGHDIRNLASLKEHGYIPTSEKEMFDRLIDITAGHMEEGLMVVFGSMQTFPDHYHVVASDVFRDGEPLEDLERIGNGTFYVVKDGEAELLDPESPEYNIDENPFSHDKIGEYNLKNAGLYEADNFYQKRYNFST